MTPRLRCRRTSTFPLLALLLAPLLTPSCSTPPPAQQGEVPVRVGGVGLDPRTESPVILLEESNGERALPIWIGFAEARSIAAVMEGVVPPRPNTHDLAGRLIRQLDARVERVVVTELRDDTYYAVLVLRVDRSEIEIDSRPSDAIAIALRAEAPVYVRESLLDERPEGDVDSASPSGEPI